MSEKEKSIAERLAEAFNVLPESKRERLIGYAEGVADAQARSGFDAEAKEAEAAT